MVKLDIFGYVQISISVWPFYVSLFNFSDKYAAKIVQLFITSPLKQIILKYFGNFFWLPSQLQAKCVRRQNTKEILLTLELYNLSSKVHFCKLK